MIVNRRRVMGKPIEEEVDEYASVYFSMQPSQSTTFKNSTNAVQYSLDGGDTWTTLAANTNSPSVAAGDTIMWKATITPTSSAGVGKFIPSKEGVKVYGNPMSLLFGDDFIGKKDLTDYAGAFNKLCYGANFNDIENVSLIANTLSINCYYEMFRNVKATKAPKLPARNLAQSCYCGMFRGSKITEPPVLSAPLAYKCYQQMFQDCTSLVTPPELPATTLEGDCYYSMFEGCTALTTAPTLPATTLKGYCYLKMFYGCTSLTTAPVLPALTLAGYCYSNMFNGCSSLNYIKAMFTTIPTTTNASNWVNGVAASGTFVKNSAATWDVTGVYGIPEGWTVQTASS